MCFSTSVPVQHVRDKPKHRIYKALYPLVHPDHLAGVQGFIRVSLCKSLFYRFKL